jgi:hypothetical protein
MHPDQKKTRKEQRLGFQAGAYIRKTARKYLMNALPPAQAVEPEMGSL